MQPIVFSSKSVNQTESRLRAVQSDGLHPTLAIVFSDSKNNLSDLCQLFSTYDIAAFGASSSGEFTHGGITEGSISAMLLDIPKDAFQVGLFDNEAEHSIPIGGRIAQWAKAAYSHPALLAIFAGLHATGEQIIEEIIDTAEQPIPVFGGFVGLQTGTEKTFIFNSTRIIENGIITVAFDNNRVGLHGVAASGWKGIGTPKTITAARGNIIYRIDDEPALDMYNKYLNIGDDPSLAYEYPLLLLRDDGSSILRGSVAINEDKSITFGGDVPQGAKVRFSIPPGLEIIDRAVDIVGQLHQQVPKADALVIFSCKGRQFTLGPMVTEEISAIHQLWDAPMIGFFTDGEIGPMPDGKCEVHNHTLVPVVIKER